MRLRRIAMAPDWACKSENRMTDEFQIQSGQRIVFIGDSITDCGRRDQAAPLGSGYVKYITQLITAARPEMDLTVFNRGIGGNVARQLLDRWVDDVIALKPDWVSVLIGINDCGRYTRGDEDPDVAPEGYEQNLRNCLKRTSEQLPDARLVILEPFLVSVDRDADTGRGRLNGNLDRYRNTARELAGTFSAVLVPLHEVFAEHLRYRGAGAYSHDAVHLTEQGAMVAAWAWLRAMGF
jgi:lysophospholipase L1-like esterase